MDEYGWRIATSMDDLKVGQVIASYSTVEASDREELVRAGRIVEIGGTNAFVDNEADEIKRIGFRGDNVVFILAEAPEDPSEAAWDEWSEGRDFYQLESYKKAFKAGWKAKEES